MIAEPGRFLSSNCFNILTRVIGKKEEKNELSITINESLHHSFSKFVDDAVNVND